MKQVANRRRVALVTAREAQALDEDLPPLTDALHHAGVDVDIVPWDAARDWSQFDMLLLRSTWDYMSRLEEFLSWAEQASRATTLVNSLPTVRWNIDKHYLGTLAAAGVPVVPTTFLEPREDVRAALERFLAADACAEFVIKPAIGAGSRDAQRHGRESRQGAVAHAERLLTAGRSILVQPYLARVDTEGEAALIFFGGDFSHSIRKGALLRPGAGAPLLLELELIEPSLFFVHAPGAAARFADCIRRFVPAAAVPL